AATPNFLRRRGRTAPQAVRPAWAHAKIRVAVAWKVTRGSPDVLVAVLDEGVDTAHKALRKAVAAEQDFIGGNGASARPDGNDAHGTACAGIVVSQNTTRPGIAPRCRLMA